MHPEGRAAAFALSEDKSSQLLQRLVVSARWREKGGHVAPGRGPGSTSLMGSPPEGSAASSSRGAETEDQHSLVP